jgi:galactitol 2-dehydrogenase (L-tagatose-forming)
MFSQGIRYDFKKEVVLITGAARGIGEAASHEFAQSNARLVLVDIDQNNLDSLKNELASTMDEKDILLIKTDISNPKDVMTMTQEAIGYFGRIDVLFNNAGINKRIPLLEVTFEDWRRIMSVNLDGMFLVAQAVGREMIKKKRGKIVNTASMSGFIVNENLNDGIYCTTKAAIVMLTKALAVEWAEFNVQVNAIAPGYTKTPLVKKLIEDPKVHQELLDRTPMHRLAEPHEIAKAVLYLASSDTTYLTGHTLKIEGGYTIW